MIMRLAPLAAFGAMAFTVGKYGLGSIVSLGKLMADDVHHMRAVRRHRAGRIARLSGFSLMEVPQVHQG